MRMVDWRWWIFIAMLHQFMVLIEQQTQPAQIDSLESPIAHFA